MPWCISWYSVFRSHVSRSAIKYRTLYNKSDTQVHYTLMKQTLVSNGCQNVINTEFFMNNNPLVYFVISTRNRMWFMWKKKFGHKVGLIFSSPGMKAHVQVAGSSWAFLMACCPSVSYFFTFSSSSPEPLGQFQPNLAQSILRWKGLKGPF